MRAAESLATLDQALASPQISARHRARLLVLIARTHIAGGDVDKADHVAASALAAASEAGDNWAMGWRIGEIVKPSGHVLPERSPKSTCCPLAGPWSGLDGPVQVLSGDAFAVLITGLPVDGDGVPVGGHRLPGPPRILQRPAEALQRQTLAMPVAGVAVDGGGFLAGGDRLVEPAHLV
jgi:hypothetical protein